MGFIQKKWRWWIVMKIDKKMTCWCTRSHDIVIHWAIYDMLNHLAFYKDRFPMHQDKENINQTTAKKAVLSLGLHLACVNVRPILTKPLQIKPCNKCCNWFFNSLFQKLNWQLAQYYSAQISALTRECPLQQCTCLSQWS